MTLAGTLWRAWQWLRGDLPATGWRRLLRVALTLGHVLLAGGLLVLGSRCLWPNQCGEGFAAGYAAAAIAMAGAAWALLWLLGEGLALLCGAVPETRRKD